MNMKSFKRDKEQKDPKLSEEEYVLLDSVMLFMRHASRGNPSLDSVLKPIAFDLMDRFYRDRPLPDGEVKRMELGNERETLHSSIPGLIDLLGGRLK